MVEGSAKAAAIAVALARALSCFIVIMPDQPLGAKEWRMIIGQPVLIAVELMSNLRRWIHTIIWIAAKGAAVP